MTNSDSVLSSHVWEGTLVDIEEEKTEFLEPSKKQFRNHLKGCKRKADILENRVDFPERFSQNNAHIHDVESNLYEASKPACVFGDNFDRNKNLKPVDVTCFCIKRRHLIFRKKLICT